MSCRVVCRGFVVSSAWQLKNISRRAVGAELLLCVLVTVVVVVFVVCCRCVGVLCGCCCSGVIAGELLMSSW